ncbi:MAG: site-specific integrase, partial [Candidatus Bathyarchaeia archaeon]
MTRKISHLLRKCMRKAGVYKRSYVLRAYAETQLIIAESKGKISHPYLQFIAGHKGDMEARYSTNKGRLPE